MAADASGGKTDEGKADTMSTVPKELPLQLLKKITKVFSDEQILGRNVSGRLYKGIMEDGEVIVVKKFSEFHSALRRKLLFMSLQEHLYEESSSIDWETRFKIIKGICQGLLFLQSNHILHFNLHPRNILLDNNMQPKIADSVNSRLRGIEQARRNTSRSKGSFVYMDPRYSYSGVTSRMTDIYSIGLLILEISAGVKECPFFDPLTAGKFVDSVRENWKDECIALEYPELDKDCIHQIRACVKIGLECVNLDEFKRPNCQHKYLYYCCGPYLFITKHF
ncbi:unnamed protein product [Alopecurus aequalis]